MFHPSGKKVNWSGKNSCQVPFLTFGVCFLLQFTTPVDFFKIFLMYPFGCGSLVSLNLGPTGGRHVRIQSSCLLVAVMCGSKVVVLNPEMYQGVQMFVFNSSLPLQLTFYHWDGTILRHSRA